MTSVDVELLRRRYHAALLTGQARDALAVLDSALDSGMPLFRLYVDIIQPVMYTIGDQWERAEVTIAEEHLATAVVQSNLAMLAGRIPDVRAASHPPRGRVLVTVTPGEQHALGSRIIADCLDGAGWHVEYLPPPVSESVLLTHVQKTGPDVLAVSLAIPTHLPGLASAIGLIRALPQRPTIAVGGSVFVRRPQLAVRFGADVTAADAVAAVDAIASATALSGRS